MIAFDWPGKGGESSLHWLGLAGFLWIHSAVAQLTPSGCQPQSRTSKTYIICVELVDNKLRRAVDSSAWGRCVVGYQGHWRFFPTERNDIRLRRYRTTDKNFKSGGDSLLSGHWTIHRKNGHLLLEDIYEHGYLQSAKLYDRKERLREWADYSIATDEEPYRCYLQKCSWVFGKETVTEYIVCNLDGNIQAYFADYVRQREGKTRSAAK